MLSPFEQLSRRLLSRASVAGYRTDAVHWLQLTPTDGLRQQVKIFEGVLHESELFREPLPADLHHSDTHRIFLSDSGSYLIICERMPDIWRIPHVQGASDRIAKMLGRPHGRRFKVTGVEAASDRIAHLLRRYLQNHGLAARIEQESGRRGRELCRSDFSPTVVEPPPCPPPLSQGRGRWNT